MRDLARGVALGLLVRGLRHHRDDVAGPPVFFAPRHDQADGALVRFLLQLGQRAGLPPAEAGAEVAQPAEQVVGAQLGDRVADQGSTVWPCARRSIAPGVHHTRGRYTPARWQ